MTLKTMFNLFMIKKKKCVCEGGGIVRPLVAYSMSEGITFKLPQHTGVKCPALH